MDEVAGILIAVGVMFVGLLILSWACGDFSQPKAAPKAEEPKPEGQAESV